MSLNAIREAILGLLANRDHSQHEVVKKLTAKGYSSDEINSLILEFIQNRWIDDRRFTENYILKRRNKGYGPYRINIELRAFGISDELIAENLQIADNLWLTEIQKVWQKRFKGEQAEHYKNRAKQIRFLQYRGFTSEQINSVIDHPEFDQDAMK
ncbi:MAG TPA: regulatory protein RecX [Gammaproteobacteria bacterium]|nr:regulatory protein RecX [Gammaproteobacteria bacterium]